MNSAQQLAKIKRKMRLLQGENDRLKRKVEKQKLDFRASLDEQHKKKAELRLENDLLRERVNALEQRQAVEKGD